MINLNKFGQIIASERLSKNMTQSQLSKILLVTPQAISKWERGECFPDIETLVLLCYEYNINIDFLLNECFEEINLVDDISISNIESYLRSSHRKEIIDKFIKGELKTININLIFYLLNTQERRILINKFINGNLDVELDEFIILLNPAERIKLLEGLTNKQHDMVEISHLLNQLERKKYIL